MRKRQKKKNKDKGFFWKLFKIGSSPNTEHLHNEREELNCFAFHNIGKTPTFNISLGSNTNSIRVCKSLFSIELLSVSFSNCYRNLHV